MEAIKHLNLDFSHRSSSAKNIFFAQKKNPNLKIFQEFKKINTLGETNTSGKNPIVIYKKEIITNHSVKTNTNINNNFSNSKNKFISDGGLKKKLNKYFQSSHNTHIHSHSIPNKKSYTQSAKKEKTKNIFPPSKKNKISKEKEKEKIFSQTIVGGFRRPNIKKTREKQNIVEILEKNKENKKIKKNKNTLSGTKNISESLMIDSENKKLERMNKLVENAIVYEMRKSQYETDKRQISLKDKINFKKKGYLEHNGIETSWTIEEDLKEYDNVDKNKENKKNTEINDGEKKEFKNKLNKKHKTETVSNSHTIIINPSNTYNLNNNNNLINSNEDPETNLTLDIAKHRKKILKPKVNQFEFIQKIQEEQKKLPMRLNSSIHNVSQSQVLPYYNKKINDSFRHKSINIKPNTIDKKNNNGNNLYDLKEYQHKQKNKTVKLNQKDENMNKEFAFANKKNKRTFEELAEFIRKKKIKERKKEEKNEYNKKKKLFEIYKNLSNLKESYNNYNFNNLSLNINNNNGNLIMNKINDTNSSSIQKRKNKKKHKEMNAYYVGTESSRSSSTVLDFNEYYLNILESQQLVVNSCFNKICDITYDNNNINNNNNEIIINDNSVKMNNYINDINDVELNEKVNDTIKRANELLLEQNQNNQNDFINIQENKEIKSEQKKNNKHHNNKKKPEKKVDEINLDNINNDAININLNINNKKNNQIKINTSSERNTKEKDLPSLPHTFSNVNNSNSNSNPNNQNNRKLQVDVDIQPCNVLNLVEVIRLIIQRKFFYKLCQLYITQSFSQRYIIAISFFVAICKQYPFRMIEDYCNYKTYYYAFRQLFRPFTRKYFKIFLVKCISIIKIGYFVDSLSSLIKYKAMEKIYINSQINEKKAQLKKICGLVLKVVLPLIKFHLKNNFDILIKYYNNKKNENKDNKDNNDNKDKNNKLNIDMNILDIEPINDKKRNKTSNNKDNLAHDSIENKSGSIHPNSVDDDTLHKIKKEENRDENNNSNTDNKKEKNNKISFSEENSDIEVNKNDLNCPKMSKHIKINFVNPSELNDIKNNKSETPSKKDINEKDINESSGKKEKIKIEKIKIIKKEDSNKKEKEKNEIELDISAEKDNINSKIIWEYDITPENNNSNEEKIKEEKVEKEEIPKEEKQEKKHEKIEEKKQERKESDDIIDLEELLIDEEKPKEIKKEEKPKKKINITKKEKFEINANIEPIKKESKITKPKTKQDFFRNFPKELIEQITSEIITQLINTEIKNPEKPIIPKKTFKFETTDLNASNNLFNSSNSFNFRDNISKDSFQSAPNFSSQQNNNNSFQYKDNNYPNFFLNESMIATVSASSIFNRTIKDKKKHKSLILYTKKIFPLMIKFIKDEIYKKYDRIYENIKIPLKNNFEKIIIGLELQNGKMIKDNYKQISFKEDIKNIIDKKNILKKIENINKELRNKDNIFDDNYYDKILNECLIDTCIDLIKKERIYGNDGEPLPYAGRTKEIYFKYEKNKPKKFVNKIIEELSNLFNTKIGLISSNYEYLTQEQLNSEKEKRLLKTLKSELNESEEHWNNLEIEETQLKLEITEIVNEQLYNEVMEILEHISLSRKRPELYQYKSIFACEDIPKLVFQQTIIDNNKNNQNYDEELINVESI